MELHLEHDPQASRAFAEAHVRRLEAMRRAGVVERLVDGSWAIADDHVERAAAYRARQLHDRPVAIETLSAVRLDRLPAAEAATWLDRTLAGEEPVVARDAGFGREVRTALAARRQWLVERGRAEFEAAGTITLKRAVLAELQRRELLRIAGELRDELGKPFVEARHGTKIEGRLTRKLDLVSGRYGLVERSHAFTLVPWRPVLEQRLGKPVAGILRGEGISWQFGRGGAGPQVS